MTDLKVVSAAAAGVLVLLPTPALIVVCSFAAVVALTFVPFGWERVRLENERRRRELPAPRQDESREPAIAGVRQEAVASLPVGRVRDETQRR
jgi:hypothetical protein